MSEIWEDPEGYLDYVAHLARSYGKPKVWPGRVPHLEVTVDVDAPVCWLTLNRERREATIYCATGLGKELLLRRISDPDPEKLAKEFEDVVREMYRSLERAVVSLKR